MVRYIIPGWLDGRRFFLLVVYGIVLIMLSLFLLFTIVVFDFFGACVTYSMGNFGVSGLLGSSTLFSVLTPCY